MASLTTRQQELNVAIKAYIDANSGGGGGGGGGGRNSTSIHGTQRLYMYANNNTSWRTLSDSSYGNDDVNPTEGTGTGAEPTIEWEHQGFLLPKGASLENFRIRVRSNSSNVLGSQFRMYYVYGDSDSRNLTGIDNDAEVIKDLLWSTDNFFAETYDEGTWTGPTGDFRLGTKDLGSYTTPRAGQVQIYYRGNNPSTTNRYAYMTYALDYLNPV